MLVKYNELVPDFKVVKMKAAMFKDITRNVDHKLSMLTVGVKLAWCHNILPDGVARNNILVVSFVYLANKTCLIIKCSK